MSRPPRMISERIEPLTLECDGCGREVSVWLEVGSGPDLRVLCRRCRREDDPGRLRDGFQAFEEGEQ